MLTFEDVLIPLYAESDSMEPARPVDEVIIELADIMAELSDIDQNIKTLYTARAVQLETGASVNLNFEVVMEDMQAKGTEIFEKLVDKIKELCRAIFGAIDKLTKVDEKFLNDNKDAIIEGIQKSIQEGKEISGLHVVVIKDKNGNTQDLRKAYDSCIGIFGDTKESVDKYITQMDQKPEEFQAMMSDPKKSEGDRAAHEEYVQNAERVTEEPVKIGDVIDAGSGFDTIRVVVVEGGKKFEDAIKFIEQSQDTIMNKVKTYHPDASSTATDAEKTKAENDQRKAAANVMKVLQNTVKLYQRIHGILRGDAMKIAHEVLGEKDKQEAEENNEE